MEMGEQIQLTSKQKKGYFMNKDSVTFFFNRDQAYIRFLIGVDDEVWPIDKFTEEIGITPTEAYKTGDVFKRGDRNLTRYATCWSIATGDVFLRYADNEDEKIFESLIEPLQSKVELINEYRKKYNLTCIFFIHYKFFDAQTPGMRLHPSVISFANSVEAIIDVYIDNEQSLQNQRNF